MAIIQIVDYDPQWPAQFAALAEGVHAAFADGPPIAVEHVGSTSIPGLLAKPIIDLDVIIPSRADLPEAIRRLAVLGYIHEGELGIPSREAFRWPPDTFRHNLYVCAEDSAELRRHLLFRDYLRAHPEAARRYGQLKRDLAARYVTDIDAYCKDKTEFVQGILTMAQKA